jgi:MarR family 2-MHQ and catechol resistance regulon transcriptional repressor
VLFRSVLPVFTTSTLLQKGPLPVNTIGPKVWLTPGSISIAVDRLEKKALVKRKNTGDRRVRLVELTAKGRALITKTFRVHAAAREETAVVLSKEERLTLLRLLKKLGKGLEAESAPGSERKARTSA